MYKQSIFAIFALGILSSNSFALEELNDIVITAKTNKSINDLSGNVTIITAEDIKKYNATNIKDVLVKSAGISIVPAGTQYGRQGISIRGSQSDHVLILVDGKKISGSDANILNSDYQYSWVPMNFIERIEVIKGAMSSIYGSEAIGGVINVITKKPDENFFGDLDFQLGTHSGKGGSKKEFSLNIGGKINEDLSIILGVEKKNIDEIEKDGDTYTEGKDYENGTVKLSYDIDDTQTINGSFILGNEERIHIGDTKYYDIKRKSYDLSYVKKFDTMSLNLDYYVTKSDNYYVSDATKHKLKNETLKGEINIESFDNNYIVLGAETKKEELKSIYTNNSSSDFFAEQSTNSFFAQDEIEIANDFILTLGTRYDDHEIFGRELSPKAGLVYKLSDNQRLKFNYGEGFIAPALKENSVNYNIYRNYGSFAFTMKGNPDLKPETSKNYEIAYEYFSDEFSAKVSIFKNDVKNLIQSSTIPGTTDYTYTNISDADIKGVEFELDYTLNSNHDLIFNYTYLDAKNKDSDEELNFRPENNANLILNSNLPYDISSTFSIKYTGEQYDSGDKIDSYTTANVQFSKMINNNLSFRIGVDNMANETLDTDSLNTSGRFTYVGLNYKF